MTFTATTITKATFKNNIWKNFNDLVKDQVTALYINASIGTATIQKYTQSYSDIDFDSKTDYPVLVIYTPEGKTEQVTNGKTKYVAEIKFEIYATQKETAEKLLDKLDYIIETNKHVLRVPGIRFLESAGTDSDSFERDGIKLHMRRSTWSFEYVFTRTGAY